MMLSRPTFVLMFLAAATGGAFAARDGGSSCAIVGDSIAVEAAKFMPTCTVNAKIGIPSGAVVARIDPSAEINVISAGTNDAEEPGLRANLERIRARAKRAVWILPAIPRARALVQEVAAAHGDPVVSFAPRGDGVHPASAATLARSIDDIIARETGAGAGG